MNALQQLVKDEKRKRIFVIGTRGDIEKFIKYLQREAPNCYKDSDIGLAAADNDNGADNDGEEDIIDNRGSHKNRVINSLQRVVHQINFKYSTRGSKILQLLNRCSEISADDLLLCTHKDPYYDLASSNKSEIIATTSSQSSLRSKSRNSSRSSSRSSSNNGINTSFPFSINHGSIASTSSFSGNANNNSDSNTTPHEELKQILNEVKHMLHQVAAMTISSSIDNKSSNHSSSSILSQYPQQQKEQQYQQQQQQSSSSQRVEEESDDPKQANQQQKKHLGRSSMSNHTNSPKKILSRINQLIADDGIFDYIGLRKTLQKEGYQDQGILTTFVNSKHQIDTLIEIFKPNNVVNSYQQVQQSIPQTVQQHQQTQQNQQTQSNQHEIQYPSFIQQSLFIEGQEGQRQRQETTIDVEGDSGIQQSSQPQPFLTIPKQQLQLLKTSKEEENTVGSIVENVKDIKNINAEQKFIGNQKKGQDMKARSKANSLSYDPRSKSPVPADRSSKSPNRTGNNNNLNN